MPWVIGAGQLMPWAKRAGQLMLYPVEVLHRVQGLRPWVGPRAQSLLPVLTRTKTTRGVPQLAPAAF